MAFKLSELFVEIKGDPAPMEKTVASLKESLPESASKLGSIFSSTFTVALGPIGWVMKAIEGLMSLLDEENEDVAALKEYWEEALEPVKELLEEVIHSGTQWIQTIVEMANKSVYLQAIFKTLQEYGSASMENIKTAIDRGVEVFNELYAAAERTLNQIIGWLTGTGVAIENALGASALSRIQSLGDKFAWLGILIRNWPEFFEIARLSILEKIENIGEAMVTLPANAKIFGEYIANNWVKLITDAVNAVAAVFHNLGSYLGELGYQIAQFLRDPTKGFKAPEWKGFLDGFKATADKLPPMVAAAFTNRQSEIAAVLERIMAREAAGFAKHPGRKKKEEEAEAEAEKQADKFKVQQFGAADFYTKLRESILSPKDDNASKTAKNTERTAKAAEDTVTELKKPKAAVMGP